MKASFLTLAVVTGVIAIASTPAFAQVELNGSYSIRMYEDYIERGPGSFLVPADGYGDFARAIRQKFLVEVSLARP